MPIDGEPRHAERVAEDDVGGLAADAGKRGERVHVGRNISAVLLDEGARGADDRFRLRAEEAGGVNLRLEVFRRGLRQRRGVGIAREERRRHQVHAGIC